MYGAQHWRPGRDERGIPINPLPFPSTVFAEINYTVLMNLCCWCGSLSVRVRCPEHADQPVKLEKVWSKWCLPHRGSLLCRGSLKPPSIKNKPTATFSLIWIVSESCAEEQPGGPQAQQGREEDRRYHQSKDSGSHLPRAFFSQDRSPGYAQDLINMKDKKRYKIQWWSNFFQNTCQR